MKWKLAACRINKGLKQKEVAELMHTSNTTIVNHETGKVKPTIAQKKMYSEIYGVPEDDIDCEIRKWEIGTKIENPGITFKMRSEQKIEDPGMEQKIQKRSGYHIFW